MKGNKNMKKKILHRIMSFFSSAATFVRKDVGAIILETAIILPIALTLVGGIFELSMYILIHNKLLRVSGVICDTITRQNTTPANVVAIMDTSEELFKPFSFDPDGTVVVSQISNSKLSNDPKDMLINWQYSINGGSSKFGTPGSAPVNLPNNIEVTSNQSMVITEVTYEYKPLVYTGIISPKSLYVSSVYVPRVGSMNELIS